MAHQKPFFRIARPRINSSSYGIDYLSDQRYAPGMTNFINAYHVIEKDIITLLDYIEPADINRNTYSHRTYELFLRVATEVESNFKAILTANGYIKTGQLNITDYFKLNSIQKLSEYEVKLNTWAPGPKVFVPFNDWHNSPIYVPLLWYQDYNSAKHDRSLNFGKASLENLMQGMAGLLVILFSQYAMQIFSQFQSVGSYIVSNGFAWVNSSLFSIKPPSSWSDNDKYDFDWDQLKNSPQPFAQIQI